MVFHENQRRHIYDRTDGFCHICHKKLSFTNYGLLGARGAWEVEHSRPRSKGGTDHGNNLYAACIPCNRDKSDCCTRTARRWNGTTKAPFSKAKKAAERRENMVIGAVVGGAIGALGGPVGLAVGALVGSQIGNAIKPAKA
jgi:hypothetical protein